MKFRQKQRDRFERCYEQRRNVSNMKLPSLHYRHFGKPSEITNIFMHGYLGSHKNFTHVSKYVASQLNQRCLELDMRNHGQSRPHVPDMSYHELAQDLSRFIKTHNLEKVNLIGYSMGAKTILEYILNSDLHVPSNTVINKVVCLDNSPMQLDNLGAEFQGYIDIVKELNEWLTVTFNNDDAEIPRDWKRLILKYLEDFDHLSKPLALYFLDLFHINEGKIVMKASEYLLTQKCLHELNYFEDYSHLQNCKIPSLFIKAKHSDFITAESWKMIQGVFTNAKLEIFDCDHKSLLAFDPEKLRKIIVDHLAD